MWEEVYNNRVIALVQGLMCGMAKSLARRPSQARGGASDLAILVPQLIHELVQ